MTLEMFDCEQGSEEWRMCRLGLPTASEFSAILMNGRGGEPSKTRRTYIMKLAGEIISGRPMETYSNPYMERGRLLEDEIRNLYCFVGDMEVQRVGFIRNGNKGCSPDSLLGNDGALEIKTQSPHLLIETILADKFPPEHKAQTQGVLWVAEREWIDLVIDYPGMPHRPSFVKRAYRDEPYIAALSLAVEEFNEELAMVVESVRRRIG